MIADMQDSFQSNDGGGACLDKNLRANALPRRERHEGEHHSAGKHREAAKPKRVFCQRLQNSCQKSDA